MNAFHPPSKILLFAIIVGFGLTLKANDSGAYRTSAFNEQDSFEAKKIQDKIDNKHIWNTVHYSTTAPEIGNLNDIRVGLFVKNGVLLSGISSGYQSKKIMGDTAVFGIRQVPLYFTQIICLTEYFNSTFPYIRFDLGTILSESVVYQKLSGQAKNNYQEYAGAIKNSNLIANIGLGVKFGNSTSASGFSMEVGYKHLPMRIPNKKQQDFFYFGFGVFF